MKTIDKDFQEGEIIRSHRVGNPNRTDKSGKILPPRQIIVRVKDSVVKKRILKNSKYLKESTDYTNVTINEDLTKRRDTIAYKARKLKTAGFISQTWTADGKIFLKNKDSRIFTISNELSLQKYVLQYCPIAMSVICPQPSRDDDLPTSADETNVISLQQSFAAVAALLPKK